MAGNGEQVNSGKTPRGRHVVAKKIGEGLPDNAVLVGREWTGELYSSALGQQSPERDWILNRILWLAGAEAGFNQGEGCDSFSRYIYIHGTPETEPMGRPLSKGCVRLHRDALLKVFDLIEEGDVVYLEEQA
jgi:lipoprotein-anchoring transpeptidase ErfK/SrfK